MRKVSWLEALPELMESLGQTAWMVGWSFLIVVVLGLAVGVILRLASPDQFDLENNIVVDAFLVCF